MSNITTVPANSLNNTVNSDTDAKYWCFMCEKEFSRPGTDKAEVFCPDCNCVSELIEASDDPRSFKPYDAQRENPQASANNTEAIQPNQRQERVDPNIRRVTITLRGPGFVNQENTPQEPTSQIDPNTLMQNRRMARAQLIPGQPTVSIQRVQVIPLGAINPFSNGPLGIMLPGIPISSNFFEELEGRIIEEFLRNDPNRYGPPPAPEESINKLKEVTFNEESCKTKDCPVCQEDYKNGDNLLVMPCQHTFHKDCVKKWLTMHNSCPVCRKPLEEREEQDA